HGPWARCSAPVPSGACPLPTSLPGAESSGRTLRIVTPSQRSPPGETSYVSYTRPSRHVGRRGGRLSAGPKLRANAAPVRGRRAVALGSARRGDRRPGPGVAARGPPPRKQDDRGGVRRRGRAGDRERGPGAPAARGGLAAAAPLSGARPGHGPAG